MVFNCLLTVWIKEKEIFTRIFWMRDSKPKIQVLLSLLKIYNSWKFLLATHSMQKNGILLSQNRQKWLVFVNLNVLAFGNKKSLHLHTESVVWSAPKSPSFASRGRRNILFFLRHDLRLPHFEKTQGSGFVPIFGTLSCRPCVYISGIAQSTAFSEIRCSNL